MRMPVIILLLTASGLILGNSYSLNPSYLSLFIAPVLLLEVLQDEETGPGRGALYGAFTGAVASVSMVPYLLKLSPLPAVLALSVMRSAQWASVSALTSFFVRREGRKGLLWFPAVTTSVEYLTSVLSPHGSGGSMAYSQYSLPLMRSLASLGGLSLILFIGTLVSTLTSFIFHNSIKDAQDDREGFLYEITYILKRTAPALLVAAAVPLLMSLRGESVPEDEGRRISILMAASDNYEGVPTDWRKVWKSYSESLFYTDRSQELKDPQILLLPEKIFRIEESDVPEFLEKVKELSRKMDTAVIVGVDERKGDKAYNRAYIVDGDSVEHYDKKHMIPGFESHFTPGREYFTREIRGVSCSIFICKDMDFPDTIMKGPDSDLLIVPAWDFDVDDRFHAIMAVMRGVENGVPVVRSARNGLLMDSDSHGNLTRLNSGKGVVLKMAEVTPGRKHTLYRKYGDIFSKAVAGILILGADMTLTRGRRR